MYPIAPTSLIRLVSFIRSWFHSLFGKAGVSEGAPAQVFASSAFEPAGRRPGYKAWLALCRTAQPDLSFAP